MTIWFTGSAAVVHCCANTSSGKAVIGSVNISECTSENVCGSRHTTRQHSSLWLASGILRMVSLALNVGVDTTNSCEDPKSTWGTMAQYFEKGLLMLKANACNSDRLPSVNCREPFAFTSSDKNTLKTSAAILRYIPGSVSSRRTGNNALRISIINLL